MATKAAVAKKTPKETEEDLRLKFGKLMDFIIESGKTSSVKFDSNFMRELGLAGLKSREERLKERESTKQIPVKIPETKYREKAVKEAMKLGAILENAKTIKDLKDW